MFEVRDLTIAQGERPLWQELSLTVKAGERLGISAPSGYGKTTLGRVLAGWQPVRGSGEIVLDGQPVPEQVKGY
ncbi:MAG: ATP-binding cassette domain-containing protein, partial [Aeromonas sobria]